MALIIVWSEAASVCFDLTATIKQRTHQFLGCTKSRSSLSGAVWPQNNVWIWSNRMSLWFWNLKLVVLYSSSIQILIPCILYDIFFWRSDFSLKGNNPERSFVTLCESFCLGWLLRRVTANLAYSRSEWYPTINCSVFTESIDEGSQAPLSFYIRQKNFKATK